MVIDDLGICDIKTGSWLIRWDDVSRIRGVKIDKVTYDENFIVIEGGTSPISFGELDEGFDALEAFIKHKFSGIPSNWRATLEVGERDDIVLWEGLR